MGILSLRLAPASSCHSLYRARRRAAAVRDIRLHSGAQTLRLRRIADSLGAISFTVRGPKLTYGAQVAPHLAKDIMKALFAEYLVWNTPFRVGSHHYAQHFLDQGWDVAKEFLLKNLLTKLPYILKNKLYMDAKSHFQEMAQEKVGVTPTYRVISESGPDHAKNFVIGVYLEDELVAEGEGTSKQEAQMEAAQNALEAKKW